jgi:hypothetical protein
VPRRDFVTLAVRDAVLARDGWRCVAPQLDGSAGNCRGEFGAVIEYPGGYNVAHLELHHVKEQPRMGKRAESDPDHLVALCPWHHKYSGWGTSKHGLGLLREYLRRKATPISSPAVDAGTDAPDPEPLFFPRKGGLS